MAKLIRDTKGRVLTDSLGRNLLEGTKWHPKLTRYYNSVIKSQGNSSSILPYLNLINEKLIENDGQVMFLTYENTTSLGLMIQTNSTQAWQVDWNGSGDWQTWNSSGTNRTKTFSTPTSGVAFIRSATGNSIEDINYVYSINGNWNFDISALSTVSYSVYFSGSNMALTGDISALSNVSYRVYFNGSLMSLTGGISVLSNVSYLIYFIGSNMTLTYATTTWGTIPSNRLHLRLSPGRLTQSEVDQLFIDLDNAGTTGTAIIDLRGSNAAPSSASASARTELASRGYTVLHN